MAGAEGLGLACRLGRCFCTSCRGLHRRPAPLNTLRVPRSLNHFTQCQNKNGHLSVTVFDLAGAEGLEPSARGFGADVEKMEHQANPPLLQPIGRTQRRVDALLMLLSVPRIPPYAFGDISVLMPESVLSHIDQLDFMLRMAL